VRRALTLVEIVLVLVIIAILLVITIPQFTKTTLAAVATPDSVVTSGASGPVRVRVTDARRHPQAGVTVRFETEGAGAVTPTEVRTDSAGVASATWHAVGDSGSMQVTARAGGRMRPELVMHSRVRPAAQPAPTAPTTPAAPVPKP